jgi:hypothetical protein
MPWVTVTTSWEEVVNEQRNIIPSKRKIYLQTSLLIEIYKHHIITMYIATCYTNMHRPVAQRVPTTGMLQE